MASQVGSDQPLKYVLKAYEGSHQITLADVQPRDPVGSESVAGCAGRKDYGMAQRHLGSATQSELGLSECV